MAGGPLAGSGRRTCYNRPSEQVKMLKKIALNDEDFVNNKIKLN